MRRIIFLLSLSLLAPFAAAQTVSVQDVQNDLAKGDYRAVVNKAGTLLASSTWKPQPSEKYQLLMVRGEAQLQLKDRIGAMTSFKSAAKLAGDVNQFAAAMATSLIVERSSMGRFTPRSGTGSEPIDILVIESRKVAMNALRADLGSQNKSQIEIALRSDTLPPIEKAFKPLSDMFCLEIEATGRADDTGQLMHEVAQRAYGLMRADISRLSQRVEQLNDAANSIAGEYGNWNVVRRGLQSNERNELKANGAYLVKLRDRASEYHGLASKLGGNEQQWDSMVLEITDTLSATDSLLNSQ